MIKRVGILVAVLLWTGLGVLLESDRQHTKHTEAEPTRIVSLAPNLTEILFALKLDDRIVAVSSDSDWPPAATEKPAVGTFWQPNIEAVIAANPTLVIGLWFEQQSHVARRLDRMGHRTLTLRIENIRQLFEAIDRIGTATGKEAQAASLAGTITDKLDNLAAQLSDTEKVRVLWVVQNEPLRVAGWETFINELIELAGGQNAIAQTIHRYPPIGAEQVIASAPQVIIQPAMQGGDLAKQQLAAKSFWSGTRWKNVPAVKSDRIYVIPSETVSRLGPRIYHGAEMIAKCLRPELFQADPNKPAS